MPGNEPRYLYPPAQAVRPEWWQAHGGWIRSSHDPRSGRRWERSGQPPSECFGDAVLVAWQVENETKT